MIQRSRMVNTLVCLVVSMSGTAVLLGWLDPSISPTPDSLPFETIESVAWQAVADTGNLDSQRWHSVKVSSGLNEVDRGALLAARVNHERSHFYVHTDGHITCGALWLNQQEITSAPGTIIVEVAQKAPGQVMSDAQWFGVRSLVRSLTESVSPLSGELPVTADSSWQAAYQSIETMTDIETSS